MCGRTSGTTTSLHLLVCSGQMHIGCRSDLLCRYCEATDPVFAPVPAMFCTVPVINLTTMSGMAIYEQRIGDHRLH